MKNLNPAARSILLISAIVLSACSKSGSGDARNNENTSTQGKQVALKSLDDPANPFKGDYGAWDYWAAENFIATPEAEINPDLLSIQSDREWTMRVQLDDEFHLVPMLTTLEEELRSASTPTDPGSINVYWVCKGEISEETREDYYKEMRKLQALYYPKVPVWLAKVREVSHEGGNEVDDKLHSDDLRIRFMPNGDIVSNMSLGRESLPTTEYHHYRYNSEGVYVSGTNSSNIIHLYKADFNEPELHLTELPGALFGYSIEQGAQQFDQIYDYDGTVLPAETNCRTYRSQLDGVDYTYEFVNALYLGSQN